MARARNIKPGLFKNEVLGVADPLYTLAFEGLWMLADKEGRLEDRPLRIKAEIFPYRDKVQIESILNWLHSNGFVQRYTVGGCRYILILAFKAHQNPHKNEIESVIPPPNSEPVPILSEPLGLIPSSLIPDSLSSDLLITSPSAPPSQLEAFTSLWNKKLAPLGYAAFTRSSPKREKALRERMKADPLYLETFTKAVAFLAEDAWWKSKASQFSIDLLICQADRTLELSEKTPSKGESNGTKSPTHRSAVDESYRIKLLDRIEQRKASAGLNPVDSQELQ